MAEAFPWCAAMRFGLGTLRLSPRDFWAMTPRELAAAMDGGTAHSAPGRDHPARAWLDAQLVRHPDAATFQGEKR